MSFTWGRLHFSMYPILPRENSPRLIFMVNWLRTTENAPTKTLYGLKSRSVSQGEPINEKQVSDTTRAVRVQVQLVDVICMRCPCLKDWRYLNDGSIRSNLSIVLVFYPTRKISWVHVTLIAQVNENPSYLTKEVLYWRNCVYLGWCNHGEYEEGNSCPDAYFSS